MSHHLSPIGTRLDNTQDVINGHEVELRIDELKEELEALL